MRRGSIDSWALGNCAYLYLLNLFLLSIYLEERLATIAYVQYTPWFEHLSFGRFAFYRPLFTHCYATK